MNIYFSIYFIVLVLFFKSTTLSLSLYVCVYIYIFILYLCIFPVWVRSPSDSWGAEVLDFKGHIAPQCSVNVDPQVDSWLPPWVTPRPGNQYHFGALVGYWWLVCSLVMSWRRCPMELGGILSICYDFPSNSLQNFQGVGHARCKCWPTFYAWSMWRTKACNKVQLVQYVKCWV